MQIGGFQRFSLIDYPGKIAAVLFLQCCNFRCHYCHNPSLVLPSKKLVKEEEVLDFLRSRIGQLNGVVISGGEPTLQEDLSLFLKKIKEMGYPIKLDTNGSRPDILKKLFRERLIDDVAMDLKAPIEKYIEVTGVAISPHVLKESISLLLLFAEFRSTILPLLHTREDLIAMAKSIQGARLYSLQSFQNDITLDPSYQKEKSFSKEELLSFQKELSPYVRCCQIR